MKNITVFIACLVMISSCKQDDVQLTRNIDSTFFEIEYEGLFNDERNVGLSQLASNVEYIKLETNDASVISANAQFFFTDSFVFVSNIFHILKFSRNGKFLSQIGSPGRGPGEINRIWDMSLLPDSRELVILQYRNLLYFSFDGKFIKSVDNRGSDFSIHVLDHDRYIAYDYCDRGWEKYIFCLINDQKDTLSVVNNNFNWEGSTISWAIYGRDLPYFKPFYNYGNRIFFKDLYNDTVYTVNNNTIVPSYYVNLGEYKIPDKLRAEFLINTDRELFLDIRDRYYYCNVLEASDKIFLVSPNYNRQKPNPNFFIFEKENDLGYLLVNENVESTGIVNDWDGGVDFWPAGSVNDQQVFIPLNIISLKNELDQIKSRIENVKFPDKQQELINMISESDITDNPILMIVTLK